MLQSSSPEGAATSRRLSALPMFFFFSSRRRHTRWNCDWSSDVCSSDLIRFAKTASAICGKPYDHLEKERIDSYTVKITPKKLDVRGKSVAIVDDVISTGGTIATAARELRSQGARRVIAACVHGLFVGKANVNLRVCDEVIATDTVPSRYTKVGVAPEVAAAILVLGWGDRIRVKAQGV